MTIGTLHPHEFGMIIPLFPSTSHTKAVCTMIYFTGRTTCRIIILTLGIVTMIYIHTTHLSYNLIATDLYFNRWLLLYYLYLLIDAVTYTSCFQSAGFTSAISNIITISKYIAVYTNLKSFFKFQIKFICSPLIHRIYIDTHCLYYLNYHTLTPN